MSAPTTAYRTNVLKSNLNGNEVSHQLAIPTDTDDILKERFHLDKLFKIQTAYGVGFIGGCLEGGANSKFHKPSRIGQLRSYFNGVNAHYLDGGLNCYGEITSATVTSLDFANVQITIGYKSSYYSETTISGYEYRIWNDSTNNWDGWTDGANLGYMAQNSEQTKTATVVFDSINDGTRLHGFEFRPYITNGEGKLYGTTVTIIPTGILTTVREGNGTSGTQYTYYRNASILDPKDNIVKLFTDSAMTNHYQPNGTFNFYYDETNYFTYGYNGIYGTYSIISLGQDTPPIEVHEPVQYSYQGYSTASRESAADDVYNHGGAFIGTIYFNEDNVKAYNNYSGTYPDFVYGSLANAGYYAIQNGSVTYIDYSGFYTRD
ncbi:hypothetical protein ADIARSV_0151 [Arcticibacter svalbardensis MN12-7]|uniref:Uncharacterized protein n=1 Tax=Arcticibacter svalbardensis MN12-7 TaxID=1150600 RepID=R9GYK6_9SPHI|nr:hypothetical protein [Arcticibacter svalbardensis]EOR96728.1 hypothetical protein ADIARSV_0151 [Arcticibacter svalbardensis MN12-7]